jgi:hypothetical protein
MYFGLMQSTHVQTLEVIGGVPPLRMRFSMLSHDYLISTGTGSHFKLNSPKIVREFNVVKGYNLKI